MNKMIILLLILSTKVVAADNVKALKMALDDEYKSLATYQKVIEDFGQIKPFINIARSERKHIEALKPFFTKYSEQVPVNKYLGEIESDTSIKEACLAGVDAETENVALYDRIFELTDDDELIAVFKRLQTASQDRHLRAFKRCSIRN